MNKPDDKRRQQVWLLAGQSNMIGYGPKGSELSPEWREPPANVMIYSGETWAPLMPADGGFGAEIGFGHAMSTAFPETDILLIKPLFGLGNLYDDWRPPNAGRGEAGQYYSALMAIVQGAMSSRPSSRIVGMLWMQGEGDAHNDLAKATTYERNLTLFIESLRNDLHAPTMKFIFGQITRSATWVHSAIVREAQEKVAAAVAGTALFDTDDLPLVDDGMHYNSAGSLELGRRFARAAISLMS